MYKIFIQYYLLHNHKHINKYRTKKHKDNTKCNRRHVANQSLSDKLSNRNKKQ